MELKHEIEITQNMSCEALISTVRTSLDTTPTTGTQNTIEVTVAVY